jgi:hypothetical protein
LKKTHLEYFEKENIPNNDAQPNFLPNNDVQSFFLPNNDDMLILHPKNDCSYFLSLITTPSQIFSPITTPSQIFSLITTFSHFSSLITTFSHFLFLITKIKLFYILKSITLIFLAYNDTSLQNKGLFIHDVFIYNPPNGSKVKIYKRFYSCYQNSFQYLIKMFSLSLLYVSQLKQHDFLTQIG